MGSGIIIDHCVDIGQIYRSGSAARKRISELSNVSKCVLLSGIRTQQNWSFPSLVFCAYSTSKKKPSSWISSKIWLSFVVSSVSLSLSHWYPGSGVYLIVSIPDLCNLTYFDPCQTVI